MRRHFMFPRPSPPSRGANNPTVHLLLAEATSLTGWRPGIGDPTVWGWLITAAYLGAGLLCLRAWRAEDWAWLRGGAGLKPRVWLVLGAGLLFLCVNKQLDLQSLVTVVGRRAAQQQGWYGRHREVQLVFVIGVACAAVGAVMAGGWYVRRAWRRYGLAVMGAGYLCAFVIIRAASFHHVDTLLFKTGAGPMVNRVLELGGIVLVGVAAWGASRAPSRSTTDHNGGRHPDKA